MEGFRRASHKYSKLLIRVHRYNNKLPKIYMVIKYIILTLTSEVLSKQLFHASSIEKNILLGSSKYPLLKSM